MIVTNECNLKCNHCAIANRPDFYDQTRLIDVLDSIDASQVVIFGGEPSLHINRVRLVLDHIDAPTSISTNLVNLHDQLIELIVDNQLSVATSWNPSRFTNRQYNNWLDNLSRLKQRNVSVSVLITLTDDLIAIDPVDLINTINQWTQYGMIESVLFEQLVDHSKDSKFYHNVDLWLVALSKLWPADNTFPVNAIEQQVLSWHFNCDKTITVYPDGSIARYCPHQQPVYKILNQCLTCDYSAVCRPCVMQHQCTFPIELYKYIQQRSVRQSIV